MAWLISTILAFSVPTLETWRPVCLAGLGTGVLGTVIFMSQLRASQRGARGAQTGLAIGENRNEM